MAGTGHPHPADDETSRRIYDICLLQTPFYELWFGPLDGRPPGVFSVAGTLMHADDEEQDVTATLWRGRKDHGDGTEGLWLDVQVESDDQGVLHEQTLAVDPGAQDFGLTVPDFSRDYPIVEGCRVLFALFDAAEPPHLKLDGNAQTKNYVQLNAAVEAAVEAAMEEDSELDDEGDPGEVLLHTLSTTSGFETISFALGLPAEAEGPELLYTQAELPLGTKKVGLKTWYEPDSDTYWLEIDGRRQPMPEIDHAANIVWPGSESEKQEIGDAVDTLDSIHLVASGLYGERIIRAKAEACAGLETLAMNAIAGGEPLSLDDLVFDHDNEGGTGLTGAAWHGHLEEFTRLCRLGLLAGVVVEESPKGPGLNVSALTMDLVTGQEVRLQVYWELVEGAAEPVHMLAAGQVVYPAHGGDPMRPELLAGFPQSSRHHILHAINHLHDLADLAMNVAAAKYEDTSSFLATVAEEGDADEILKGEMQDEVLEDALAALNGIARIYTGSHIIWGSREP